MNIRNVAIIAHVDHGKTTLVNQLLKYSGTFRQNENIQDLSMDSNPLERERGITILAKTTSVMYKDTKINRRIRRWKMKDIYVDIRRSGIENYFPNKDMVTVDELINKIDELDTKIYRLEKENEDLIEYKNQYCEILKNIN